MMRRAVFAFGLGLVLLGPALAVEPGEMLQDPALEARARIVSEGLRCLVCQNESIDDSHAELAHDIRRLVRERLVAGDTNAQATDYLVARYGQFILLRPPVEMQTLLLWGTPVIVLLLGGVGMLVASRRTPPRDPGRPLSEAEQKKLDVLLAAQGGTKTNTSSMRTGLPKGSAVGSSTMARHAIPRRHRGSVAAVKARPRALQIIFALMDF